MDHDRLFKELLTIFFIEFLKLFLPKVARQIDPRTIEFLDKEIFTDVASGERHEVDLLVKVRFRGIGAGYFLIHIENQAKAISRFPRRMFHYFAELDKEHDLRVFPIAIFSFDRPMRPEPDCYSVEFPWKKVLNFRFHSIQLNQLNWRKFLRNPNPVAAALMTRMKIAPEDRPRVKLECLRMLVTLRLDRARATLISSFMDSYLKLTASETKVYNQELKKIQPKEREAVMEWTNEWIRKGEKKGRKEGLAEGRRTVVGYLLRRRFSDLPARLLSQIKRLSDAKIDQLAEGLLDFRDAADVEQWFTNALKKSQPQRRQHA